MHLKSGQNWVENNFQFVKLTVCVIISIIHNWKIPYSNDASYPWQKLKDIRVDSIVVRLTTANAKTDHTNHSCNTGGSVLDDQRASWISLHILQRQLTTTPYNDHTCQQQLPFEVPLRSSWYLLPQKWPLAYGTCYKLSLCWNPYYGRFNSWKEA